MSHKYNFSTKPNTKIILNFEEKLIPPFSWGVSNGSLVYDNSIDKFVYTPQKDFTGNVAFKIAYDNGQKNISVEIEVVNTFKPRARIIKIIGQELISNDVIALVELIKNSFDADSKKINITLNDIFDTSGEIIIEDDGTGMTYEKVTNVWLEPATPDKKSDNNSKFSKCFQRRFLGEKGIGRFAVHRLGDKIELITRATDDCGKTLSNYETRVEIDWNDFTDDKYLEEIPIKVYKNEPPVFFKNSGGTYIRISNIHPWKNTKAVRDAVVKLRSLESPVKPENIKLHKTIENNDPGVKIDVISNDPILNQELKDIKSLAELLDTAFYQFKGTIDEDGIITYQYIYNRVDYQDFKRDPKHVKEDLKKYNTQWFEEQPLNSENTPGEFEINFFAWDLDSAALKVAGLASYYRNVIKPNAGVRIYRDNFRVWPYGEPDEDWLNLDLTRLNAPTDRSVSRNQVFGLIHISSTNNPELKDQSNREGLIVSQQYEQFYQLVKSALSVFARERKYDKIRIDKTTKTRTFTDVVTDNIQNLRLKVEKNNHEDIYFNNINSIEKSYRDRINDILERYMMAAAIGISYSLPIHEMKLRLTSIKHIIDDLEENPQLQDKYLRQLSIYVKETDDIIKAVTSIMSRQKKQPVDLKKVANNVRVLKESDFRKYDITYNIIDNSDDFIVDAVPGLLNTAVLNIVDNAVYWLRFKKNSYRAELKPYNPKITVEFGYNPEKRKYIRISDNGYGFEDPFELLTEPYYSRKSDGLGLGLYLVNEIMMRFGGYVVGYNNNGAVIELIF